MTKSNNKNACPKTTKIRQTHQAASAETGAITTVVIAGTATATTPPHTVAPDPSDSADCPGTQLRSAGQRNRKPASAEPLAKFRATGVTTWDKAEQYEWDAIRCVGQFGLLSTRQLGEWIFKDLATPSARHRQAQALTLRMCPQARAHSNSQRLATAGHRPVLRALGRKLVGNQHYYFLNTCGQLFMQQNYSLALPDAAKLLTTVDDMAKRGLAFEHCLARYRADCDLDIVGTAALPAAVARQQDLAPLARVLLKCLSNLWCSFSRTNMVTYTYVADRPASSNGPNVAHYRELARAASLILKQSVCVEVIGRRLPTETACALTDTQLAQSVSKVAAKEAFWSKDGKQFQASKLVAFFASLKPHAEFIRVLMELHRAQ